MILEFWWKGDRHASGSGRGTIVGYDGDLILARGNLDRDELSRSSPQRLAELAENAGYLLISGWGAVLDKDDAPLLLNRSELPRTTADSPTVYLGKVAGRPYFACDLTTVIGGGPTRDNPEVDAPGYRIGSLQNYAPSWSADMCALVTAAVAILNTWRATRWCAVCGQRITVDTGGWSGHCPEGHVVFPRTDPAVIMAVLDSQDRILLAHNARWPAGRHSVLAGFAEAGESLEAAVRREVREEVGVPLGEIRYFASQPWPFPRSLMIAYVAWVDRQAEARAGGADSLVRPDGEEIDHAAFYSPPELDAALREGSLSLPGPSSVAAALIADWYGPGIRPHLGW
ncbi:NAD(+) diphosphatase [Actinotignum sp. GS-2025b]|uniref:NAD(+) diphosphatase n=1 Tax=Actinotignum sp. GS-2025b TaxID=3427275 RepID=UPI003F4820E8